MAALRDSGGHCTAAPSRTRAGPGRRGRIWWRGVFAFSGAGAFHAAFAVVAVGGQAVAQQVACAVVLVGDAGGSGVACRAGGLLKAQQAGWACWV